MNEATSKSHPQDWSNVEALIDLARNVAGLDGRYTNYAGPLPDAVREWQNQARAILDRISK